MVTGKVVAPRKRKLPRTPLLTPGRGIALALSGGAALGWAHIGALRLLAEHEIPIGAVAGSSIGALAALCLAHHRLDALEEIAATATPRRILAYLDLDIHRGAFLGGRRIARELALHFGDIQLQDLAIPTAIVATDLDDACEIRLTEGSAIEAVRASMALPGLFRPVFHGGRMLIDGGVIANLPVAAARALCPQLPVVAIDLIGDYAGHVGPLRGLPRSAFTILRSAFQIMAVQQTRDAIALDRPDIVVVPAIGHLGAVAFTHASELMALGREATLAALPQIKALAGIAQKTGKREKLPKA